MPVNEPAGEAVDASRGSADDAARDGWGALFAGPNLARSVVLTGAVAIHALSLRVVVTVLPLAVLEIGGLRFFAWTMTVAMISAIWGAASAAPLAVSYGLRRAYHIALALFVVGSIVCALSPNMGVFLAGRLFQGLGGGLSDGARLHDDLAGLSAAPAHTRNRHAIHGLEHCRSDRAAGRRHPRGMGPLALGILG